MAVLPALGQSANLTGIPDDATVFELTFKPGKGPQGNDVLYGAIEIRGELLKGDYPKDDSDLPTNLSVRLDYPRQPGTISVLKTNLEAVRPQSDALRLKRYTDDGFIVTEGRNNTEILVPKTTADRLSILRDMEAEQARAAESRVAPFVEVAGVTDTQPAEPGILSLWGPHALTVIVAGLALFGVVRTCFT